MLHPRLTPVGATLGGSSSVYLSTIGTYGAWSDLQMMTRWGDGASGMYEAQWSMPLPPDFDHPLLRRGAIVELMDGPYRVGSPLILNEPSRGGGLDQPWTFVASGIGREVEGENSWYADDGFGNATTILSTAINTARSNGLAWDGYDTTSTPSTALGPSTTNDLQTIGQLANSWGDKNNTRWLVGQDNLFRFASDPTTPTYQVVPGVASLGTADDDYATVVKVRFLDSTAAGSYTTAQATNSQPQALFGRREFPVDLTDQKYGQMTPLAAFNWASSILAKYKGRLGWTNGITVTSNDILTMGGASADLSKVLEDVGNGCMIRLHGIWSDLLAYNGQTWLDIIVGEAKYADGAQSIDLSPMGLAKRDLAGIIEEVTGVAAA